MPEKQKIHVRVGILIYLFYPASVSFYAPHYHMPWPAIKAEDEVGFSNAATVLQIRGRIKDNSKITFLICQQKHTL